MAEPRTYLGSCHCGSVRFEVTLELGPVLACNCSMDQRRGSLLAFVPAGQFRLLTEAAPLSEYRFNRKQIRHLFCPTCGIHPFARGTGRDGQPMVAVNVRCLEGIDVAALTINHFDGRSL